MGWGGGGEGGRSYNVCLFEPLMEKGSLLLNALKINEVDFKGD